MGKKYLGIEFGSTRIKSVLIDERGRVEASGAYTWENAFEDGLWTYSEKSILEGLRESYSSLVKTYGQTPELSGLGVSAMMHGYIALDKEDNLLVPFRTWRNTNTGEAAEKLTELFGFNIPMRWSVAHLYQAILNGESHVKDIAYLTTLSGYVHYKLTGKKVLGVGDASGMFPIDGETGDYDEKMLSRFDALVSEKGYPWKLRDVLPAVLPAGRKAGTLTETGAKLLDGSGKLSPGVSVCSPEGDAGTGMVATNSVKEKTGNVSAGTSVFAMVVLEKPLKELHTEIDMVATPDGKPVAMVHCNNCTSDINAWAGLFDEVLKAFGKKVSAEELMTRLFEISLRGDEACGKITSYNYFSGEPITDCNEGRPLLVRSPDGKFDLANFMKSEIYSSLASLRIGMEILRKEDAKIEEMCGHGGFFKTPEVGQRAMSAAVNAPVTVRKNAGEGGAWGIALLAAFTDSDCALDEFLNGIFKDGKKTTVSATEQDKIDFNTYLVRYKAGLTVERKAAEAL